MRLGLLVMSLIVFVAGIAGAAPPRKLEPAVAVKQVEATSTFADKQDRYAAWRALAYQRRLDPDREEPPMPWSAWCEGKKDEGRGQKLTITLAEPTRIDRIRIAAGVWRTAKLFAANNRITSLIVELDGKPRQVKPAAGQRWLELAVGAKVSTIAITIDAVKKGRMNDSCISGIDLVRGGVRLSPVIGIDAAALAALPATIAAIERAIEAPDRKGLQPLIEFPFSHDSSNASIAGHQDSEVVAATWSELVAACKRLPAELEAADDMPVPTACPGPPSISDDAEPLGVTTFDPGVIQLTWPSGRELLDVWMLGFSDRWRLQSIGWEGMYDVAR